MKNERHLHHFIHNIYLRNALNAAVSRGRVYTANPVLHAKIRFRDECKQRLTALGIRYYAWEWDLPRFCQEIQNFSNTISQSHKPVLANGRLRVGTAQKMISLYLKYLWLSGDPSKKPIGAVLDRRILQASGYPNPPDWTELDDMTTYEAIQKEISKKAASDGFDSPAVWEAEKWGVDEQDEEG